MLSSCATPHPTTQRRLQPDQEDSVGGSFIESADIRTAASRICPALLSLPEIARSSEPTYIAVAPVVNSTRHVIDKDLVMARLRLELNRYSEGRIRFFSQGVGQDVRREIISGQDEEAWSKTLDECAQAVATSDAIKKADRPVMVAVIPVRNPNLAGLNPDFLTTLLRPRILAAAPGKIQFVAREAGGKIIEQILAETDLKNVGLVAVTKKDQFAGVDYFLGGEFVAESLLEQSVQTGSPTVKSAEGNAGEVRVDETPAGRSPNVKKHLNLMLIDASTGAIALEKMVRVERKMESGLAQSKFLLTGELRGLSKAARGGDRSDYTLMSFQLVNPQSNVILWEDAYEAKRETDRNVIYK